MVQWSEGFSFINFPYSLFIDCYVFSPTTSYVFITGIDNLSIYRLTVESGVVTSSELFIENNQPSFMAVGTYIIDEMNIKVLRAGLFTSSSYEEVGLCSITLNGPLSRMVYERGLPYFTGSFMSSSGVFVSPTKYYFALSDWNIF